MNAGDSGVSYVLMMFSQETTGTIASFLVLPISYFDGSILISYVIDDLESHDLFIIIFCLDFLCHKYCVSDMLCTQSSSGG
jgi:hypothetical protein